MLCEAQATIKQVARHRQLRSLLLTQDTLVAMATTQLQEETHAEGGWGYGGAGAPLHPSPEAGTAGWHAPSIGPPAFARKNLYENKRIMEVITRRHV